MPSSATQPPVESPEQSDHPRQELPEYASEMADFHQAFADELRAITELVPVATTARILDVGAGDGFYTGIFSKRLGPTGCVVALDVNRAFLKLAKRQSGGNSPSRTALVQGKLKDFPAEEKFDVVWCAQSLYSLPEPKSAVQDMARLVKPGGLVAILENDSLHQLLLPWPVPLELAIRTAEYAALQSEQSCPDKFYIGRRLWSVLAEAGLEPEGFHTQCIARRTPLAEPLERFLTAYLQRLAERISPRLPAEIASDFRSLIAPRSPEFILRQPYFTMGLVNALAWGRKPTEPAQDDPA